MISLSTTYSDLEDAEISFCRALAPRMDVLEDDNDADEEEEEEEDDKEPSFLSTKASMPPFGSGLIVVPYSSEM